jgi:L-seryl-tRNA(Ser) seleniumtransferase
LRAAGIGAEVVKSSASTGAGAFPAAQIPSFGVALYGDPEVADARLRAAALPVIGRISGNRLLLDMRSVPQSHDEILTAAVISALS